MNHIMHLVSGLDGTWIHPAMGPYPLKALEAHLESMLGMVLTIATARSLGSALGLLANRIRRWPDHLITDMGTAIHHRLKNGEWEEDSTYAAWVQQRWEGEFLRQTAHRWMPAGMQISADQPSSRLIVLEVLPDRSRKELLERLQMNLSDLGAKVDVLAMEQCVNLLPPGVGNGSAATFLHWSHRIEGPMVACGNSESDLGLFSVADASVLMPDSPLCTSSVRRRIRHAYIPESPGPAGILQAIQSPTLTYT